MQTITHKIFSSQSVGNAVARFESEVTGNIAGDFSIIPDPITIKIVYRQDLGAIKSLLKLFGSPYSNLVK